MYYSRRDVSKQIVSIIIYFTNIIFILFWSAIEPTFKCGPAKYSYERLLNRDGEK